MATNIGPFIEEIDLREELIQLFSGDEFVPKFRTYIYRESRLDSNGNKIKCHCYNHTSREGKSDCPDCYGAGYFWDEKIIIGHMWMPRNIMLADQSSYKSYGGKVGRLTNSNWIMVIPYKLNINERDHIYIPEVDDEGRIKYPVVYNRGYYISEVTRLGFDFGRRDFTTIGLTAL